MTATELTGLVPDLDEDTYHAHPALSRSGALKLLPPSCPALYRWERDHPQPTKRVFDIGKAAHTKLLGRGVELVVVDAADWRTKDAQRQRDEAYAAGKTPLLPAEDAATDAMVAAVHSHPVASKLFDPTRGRPEVSAFWEDWAHGVSRKARFDWLPDADGGRLIIPDLKTTVCAEPSKFTRAVGEYGYALQAVWYCDAVRARPELQADDVSFRIVAVEKTPPHLVTVIELDDAWLRIGRQQAERALRTFADCEATGRWPGYSDDVELLHPPAWLADDGGDDPWGDG